MGKKICILGTGSGGLAVAGNLTFSGNDIILWDDGDYASNIEAIRQNDNCIEVTGQGTTGTARLYAVTTDLEAAMNEADFMLLIMPSSAFALTAKKLSVFIKPGMKLYICCGSTGGSLQIAKIFHDEGVLSGVYIGEFSELPYGCFKTGPTSVRVNTVIKFNEFSAFPAKYTSDLLPEINEVFYNVTPIRDVLQSGLANGNIICHGPVMMLNAAGTEGNPDNHHFRDGVTPSVARVMDAMDCERMAVCRGMGYEAISVEESCVLSGYCPEKKENSYLTYRGSHDFMTAPGPTTLNSRYMTEDVPFSALVVSAVGDILGIDTPLIDAMITICSALMNEDYWRTGRTAEALGIQGMDRDSILLFLQKGYPES